MERIIRSTGGTDNPFHFGHFFFGGEGMGQTILEAEIINIKEEFRSALADYADKLA